MPFELKHILAALDFVPPKKYVRLGVNLGLGEQEVLRMEEDHSENCERVLIGIISRWMRNVTDPKPSWESLEEALRLTVNVHRRWGEGKVIKLHIRSHVLYGT